VNARLSPNLLSRRNAPCRLNRGSLRKGCPSFPHIAPSRCVSCTQEEGDSNTAQAICTKPVQLCLTANARQGPTAQLMCLTGSTKGEFACGTAVVPNALQLAVFTPAGRCRGPGPGWMHDSLVSAGSAHLDPLARLIQASAEPSARQRRRRLRRRARRSEIGLFKTEIIQRRRGTQHVTRPWLPSFVVSFRAAIGTHVLSVTCAHHAQVVTVPSAQCTW